MERTDAQLIRDASADADAFAELYGRHARAVHAWFRARAREPLALDLTAETFARAALSLGRFRDEADGSAGPWIFGIARNVLRRSLEQSRIETRARARLGLPADRYELDLDEVATRLTAQRLRPQLVSALRLLTRNERRALELRVVGELPYADVAASLGTTEVAARLRVMRALGTLSRALKGASQ